MAGDDSEWQTVRRRRSTASAPLKKLKALPIPVVPLAFDALAVPDDAATILAREKRKKKRLVTAANKRSAATKDSDDDEADSGDDNRQAQSPAVSRQHVAPSRLLASALSPFLHLWAQLLLLITWLRTLLRFGTRAKGSKRPSKAAAQTAAGSKTAAALKAAAATPLEVPSPAPAVGVKAGQPRAAVPAAKATATAAANPPAATNSPVAVSPPQVTRSQTAAKASVPAYSAPVPEPAPQLPPAPAPAPKKQASPVLDCDPDWQAAQLLLSHVPGAHSDVVSSVALAGDLALSGGYDGALKLWFWSAGTGGKSGAPLRPIKNLTGHTGYVEAVCADGATMRAVSSGRDSSLKVWDLDGPGRGAGAREAASYYVYESVKCMSVDWATHGALLGSRSGAVSSWNLETGRKLQTLKGHTEEVTALRQSGSSVYSGSRDATVRVWDVRTAPGKQVAILDGARGRVCSLDINGHLLYVGDTSSSLKVYDLRELKPRDHSPSYHVANAPAFAGDACPVAGLGVDARTRILLSSSIAWWTPNTAALEEAAADCQKPMAVLNVSAAPLTDASPTYLYTVRLGPGIVTCLDSHTDGRMLMGTASGGLSALRLLKKGSKAAAVRDEGDAQLAQTIAVGVQEFSDDEDDDDEDDEESE